MYDESNECPGSDDEYSSIIDTERCYLTTDQKNTNSKEEINEEQSQEPGMNEHIQNGASNSQTGESLSGSVVQDHSRSHSQTKSPESTPLRSSLPKETENEMSKPSVNKLMDPDNSFSREEMHTNYCEENQYSQNQYIQQVENVKVSEASDISINYQTSQLPQFSNSGRLNVDQTEPNSSGRLVIDAVPSMNSQTNDLTTDLHRHMGSLVMEDGSQSQVCNYSPTQKDQPRMIQHNAVRSTRFHRSQATMQCNSNSPATSMQSNVYAQPVYASPPRSDRSSPGRKSSSSSVHIGSHVISAESGPSFVLLLRRPTSERQWGFTFHGGSEFGCPPFVNKISANSLAQKYGLEVGDVIVSICNSLTVGKTNEQLRAEILRAGNELDMVLIRRGVDVEKITQIAPFAIPSTPRSAPVGCGSKAQNVFDFNVNRKVVSPKPSVSSIGRTFRNVQTKSLKILEKQLSAGETPSSVLKSKQHFQGARGLSASGSSSSFTTAYGQGSTPGYCGREIKETISQTNSTTIQCNIRSTSPKPMGTSHSTNIVSGYPNYPKTNTTEWCQSRPNWDNQNVNWVTAIPSTQCAGDNSSTQQTCQNIVYSSQSKFSDEMTLSKHSISPVGNPGYGTQTWIGRTN